MHIESDNKRNKKAVLDGWCTGTVKNFMLAFRFPWNGDFRFYDIVPWDSHERPGIKFSMSTDSYLNV